MARRLHDFFPVCGAAAHFSWYARTSPVGICGSSFGVKPPNRQNRLILRKFLELNPLPAILAM